MILITTGLVGFGIEHRHEFGHLTAPKLWQVNLGFLTVIIVKDGSKFYDYLREFNNSTNGVYAPQYREALKREISKIRKREKAYMADTLKRKQEEVDYWSGEYRKLSDATVDLRNLAYSVRRISTPEVLKKLEEL